MRGPKGTSNIGGNINVKKKPFRKHWRRRKGKKLQNYVQKLIRKTFPHLKKKDVGVAGNGVNGPDIIFLIPQKDFAHIYLGQKIKIR